jgi:hypothetical protein
VWPGGTDDQAGGVNLGWIRKVDPDWDLLHNADGSLATIGGWIKGWNLAAPASRGVPTEVAKLVAYAAKRDGIYSRPWDGVHTDNWIYSSIGASWFYGPNIDSDRNRVADDLTMVRRDWSNGLTLVGNNLRSYLPGKIVGGNGAWFPPYTGSDANGWLKASNYTLIEHMQKFSPATILSTAKTWLGYPDPLGQPRYLAALAYATDRAGTVLNWTQGDINTAAAMQRPDVLRSMRWGLTLAAMTGIYYELIGDWAGNPVVTRWWFDEYDGGEGVRKRGYLGQPLGPYQEIRTAVYRRDFQNGIAINNSSSTTQTINLGCGSCRRIKGTQDSAVNNGSPVSSVVVRPDDGIIVLRK